MFDRAEALTHLGVQAFVRRITHRALFSSAFVIIAALPTQAQTPCLGDCNGDGSVTVNEIVALVSIALGNTPVSACAAGDANNDSQITIDEILTAVNNALNGCPPSGSPTPTSTFGPTPAPTPVIPFSASNDCAQCHPRQVNEWKTSPHAYSGISPTFWSLMAAGQNGGAGVVIDGVSVGGAVGNFCAPCHGPQAFIGERGSLGGNNDGFANVQPEFPFVCANLLLAESRVVPCTAQTSREVCGEPGQCSQFEGRACANTPPLSPGISFPRQLRPCASDAECGDAGPCILTPSTVFFSARAQEGISCETCHNMQPNFRRACQLFRNSDAVGTFSFDVASRTNTAGARLRLGPYPLESGSGNLGRPNDAIAPASNPFHESARVDSPLAVPYSSTDRANGVTNPDASALVARPTELTCAELPYCSAGRCEGGENLGALCMSDADCGGCGPVSGSPELGNRCGGTAAGAPCLTSTDCGRPANAGLTVLDRGIADGTVGPLTRQPLGPRGTIDRTDGNYFRSGMMCATCHDVRPPQVNMILRSCQLQKTHVCATDADCRGLNVGCSNNDCGPCVAENNTAVRPFPAGDPRNTGFRRVENLFSEWQLSVYNHPELTFCQGDSFKACATDADCGLDGPCNVRSPFGRVITCQNCHMSNFPEVPLIRSDGSVTAENDLYSEDLAALEGSQADPSEPLPRRRVSTHFMSGVDLPLVAFPGQSIQDQRRQALVDASFKVTLDETPTRAVAGEEAEVEVTIENVGVGHRVPSGFSHERQFWVQMFVQDAAALGTRDPFDPAAPCNLQRNVATGADDARDPEGAAALADAGCVYRSGFVLDKAHPETGENAPDGSGSDEDPEDFFVVAGTRVRGAVGSPRVEIRPGAEGRALIIQNICAKATEEAYRAGVRDGTGIDLGTDPSFPHQVRFCRQPSPNPAGTGVTPSGFGNPDCMENGEDLGPCVQEIELSDGNERGRCARNLTKAMCQSDAECGDDGPCLFRCTRLPELECCDPTTSDDCRRHYARLGVEGPCILEPRVCVGGSNSGQVCTGSADCPGAGATCGDVGPCKIENRGIVNFQNQFRSTTNGVCVDPANPRIPDGVPIPVLDRGGQPVPCLLNISCLLAAVRTASGSGAVCLVNGQCENTGAPCTNYTFQEDCGGAACNVEANLELNGRASESVFIQNHPFNFNSLPPFQPRTFKYDFRIPERFRGRELVVAARIMNRHFPMRFLRNLIGTQVVRPPLVVEAGGNPAVPGQCTDQRRIDIDCFVRPLAILGNAERGGFVPPVQRTRVTRIIVE
ncbi:MAG: hypothetical protein ACE5I7_08665 [Candidatus Binatia bacterium]